MIEKPVSPRRTTFGLAELLGSVALIAMAAAVVYYFPFLPALVTSMCALVLCVVGVVAVVLGPFAAIDYFVRGTKRVDVHETFKSRRDGGPRSGQMAP
jgi:hypothetical protein